MMPIISSLKCLIMHKVNAPSAIKGGFKKKLEVIAFIKIRVKSILKKIINFMNAVYEFVTQTRTARDVLNDIENRFF